MSNMIDQLSDFLEQRDILHIRCAPPLSDNNGPQILILQDNPIWIFAYSIHNLNLRSCHHTYYDYQKKYGKQSVILVRGVIGMRKCLTMRNVRLYNRIESQQRHIVLDGLTQYESDVAEVFDECSDDHDDCAECRAIERCQSYHATLGDLNCPDLLEVKHKLHALYERSQQCELFGKNQYLQQSRHVYHCIKCGKPYHHKRTCAVCGGAVGSYKDHYYTTGKLAKEFGVSRDTVNRWEGKGYISVIVGMQKKKKVYSKESVDRFRNELLPQLIQDGKVIPKAHHPQASSKKHNTHTKKPLKNYKCQTCGTRYDCSEYNNMYSRSTNIARCRECKDGVVVRQQLYTSIRNASIYTGVHATALRQLVRDGTLPGTIIKQSETRWYYQFTQKDLDYIKRWYRHKK